MHLPTTDVSQGDNESNRQVLLTNAEAKKLCVLLLATADKPREPSHKPAFPASSGSTDLENVILALIEFINRQPQPVFGRTIFLRSLHAPKIEAQLGIIRAKPCPQSLDVDKVIM